MMPNRILKESICKSNDINKLSPLQEATFYRIIVKCDDYGRMEADADSLKSDLYPKKRSMTMQTVVDAANALANAGMVCFYEVDDQPYLYLPAWEKHQTIRAQKSKHPAPDESCRVIKAIEINGNHLYADVHVIQSNPIRESNAKSVVDNAREEDDPAADLSSFDLQFAEVQRVYAECELGKITPHIDNELAKLATEHSPDWVIRAMRVTADKPDDRRHLGMVKGILREWKRIGRPDDDFNCARKDNYAGTNKPSQPDLEGFTIAE